MVRMVLRKHQLPDGKTWVVSPRLMREEASKMLGAEVTDLKVIHEGPTMATVAVNEKEDGSMEVDVVTSAGQTKIDCLCPHQPTCDGHAHYRLKGTGLDWECSSHEHAGNYRVQDQPAPIRTDSRPVWELVIEDMQNRDKLGRERYGTPLQVDNGRDHLVDLYQELLDAVVYIRAEIETRRTE